MGRSASHSNWREPRIVAFTGGSGFDSLARPLTELCPHTAFVLPVSDDGGSTRQIVNVLGGPGSGDIRKRCLVLSDDSNEEARRVRDLLAARLPTSGDAQAKAESYEEAQVEKILAARAAMTSAKQTAHAARNAYEVAKAAFEAAQSAVAAELAAAAERFNVRKAAAENMASDAAAHAKIAEMDADEAAAAVTAARAEERRTRATLNAAEQAVAKTQVDERAGKL